MIRHGSEPPTPAAEKGGGYPSSKLRLSA